MRCAVINGCLRPGAAIFCQPRARARAAMLRAKQRKKARCPCVYRGNRIIKEREEKQPRKVAAHKL